jgi:aryl-alcohol dehydrogenase-like predicted oxidoreductase
LVKNPIAKNVFGASDHQVTVVGLGGEGILRTHGQESQASTIIKEAADQGITYFDSARAYADSELYYGSVWGEDPDMRLTIFQASKSASRDKNGALADLKKTLTRMRTNHLDLWQIHDVRTDQDIRQISGPGGALEAFIEARSSGKVRFIGVTGHHNPEILTRAVQDWPVDAVMLPVNPVEGLLGGFLTSTLPAARAKGIAVIGMKILGASYYIQMKLGITPSLLIRYAISQGITVAIVGCSTPDEVRTLAENGQNPVPLSEREQSNLMQIFEPQKKQLAFYRGVI